MEIMGLVTVTTVTLPEGRAVAVYRGRAMNTGLFSTSACFAPLMVWILEKPDSLLPQAD